MDLEDRIRAAIERAQAHLLREYRPEGFWEGHLASSPLATAVTLCAFADEPHAGIDRTTASRYLAANQNADGGWGDTGIGKSNLAATALALSAHVAEIRNGRSGLLPEENYTRASAYIERLGGLRAGLTRIYGNDLTFQVPIRLTAAASGLLEWNEVNALPLELSNIPRSWMGWLGLPVVSYALPVLACVGLARHNQAPSRFPPLRWIRAATADSALEKSLKMQAESGSYMEAIPITAFCMLALKCAGRSEHPIVVNARRFLCASQRCDGAWPIELHLSTWNTSRAIDCLEVIGALDTALSAEQHQSVKRWLLAQQSQRIHPYNHTSPGGWGWNHLDGSVPDADDTSGSILALRALGMRTDAPELQKGLSWLCSLQNYNGGFPTFCRGWLKLPFDRSAPDLTAHALRALAILNAGESSAAERAWRYLAREQCKDGCLKPLWFGCETAEDEMNAMYGTTHVLFACKLYPQHKLAQQIAVRALNWLRDAQNADGGFGGVAGAPSSTEETGLALRALALFGETLEQERCRRAAEWLLRHQEVHGSWRASSIGFYFSVLWYYERMYPLCYGLGGLGAILRSSSHQTREVSMRAAV